MKKLTEKRKKLGNTREHCVNVWRENLKDEKKVERMVGKTATKWVVKKAGLLVEEKVEM